MAEAAVKQMKGLFKKVTKLDENFRLALLEHRNAPPADGYSPSEMFFARRLRTGLPDLPTQPNLSFAEAARGLRREVNKEYFDQSARPLPPFEIGDRILMQDSRSKEWIHPGEVVEIRESGRSYRVRLDGADRIYLRNRRFLRKDFRHTSVSNGASKEEENGQKNLNSN